MWISSEGDLSRPGRVVGPAIPLQIIDDWTHYQKTFYFSSLLKVLRGETRVAESWRNDLRKAAVLIGLSQSASNLTDAFLWNMIALELLLTRQGDKVEDALPGRSEAFLGWVQGWKDARFEERIRNAYRQRCRIVHQGVRDEVSSRDLYFVDDLLLNLMTNLVARPNVFDSKDAVVAFSKKIEAQRLLGLPPDLKGLSFTTRSYSERDYQIY